jgi:hypothetical protein
LRFETRGAGIRQIIGDQFESIHSGCKPCKSGVETSVHGVLYRWGARQTPYEIFPIASKVLKNQQAGSDEDWYAGKREEIRRKLPR